MSIDKTLAERGSRYGEFDGHALVTQNIKAAIKDSARWGDLADDQKEALEMVAHKIGRIVNGDPNYIDSWTDIIGYTRLVEKRLIDEQKTSTTFAFDSNQAATSGAVNHAQGAESQKSVRDFGEISVTADAVNHAQSTDPFDKQLEDALKKVFGQDIEIHHIRGS